MGVSLRKHNTAIATNPAMPTSKPHFTSEGMARILGVSPLKYSAQLPGRAIP